MRRALLVIAAAALLGAAIVPVATGGPAAAGDPPKVAIYGDSMAVGLANHMIASYPAYEWVNHADGACNIGLGQLLTYSRQIISSGVCENWKTHWPPQIASEDPDVVVLMTGGWEKVDRYKTAPASCLPGPWCPIPPFRITEERGDRRYRNKLEQAIEVLGAGGAHVIVVAEPYSDAKRPVPTSGPIQNVYWEPYPDTKPGPTNQWPDGWRWPTKGAKYIPGRLKTNALVAQQQLVKSTVFASDPNVHLFDALGPLSPGGNSFAKRICPPPYAPGENPCPEDKVLVRAGDRLHLTDVGNGIIGVLLDEQLQVILGS